MTWVGAAAREGEAPAEPPFPPDVPRGSAGASPPGGAAPWPAAIAFSNPLMTYSYLIFSELPTGLLLIYAFRRLALGWRSNGPMRLLLTGACIGYIPWLAWRCVPIAMGLGAYAAWQWRRARPKVRAITQARRRWFHG